MEAYTGFASVYDLFMDNIPYKDWCAYVTGLLKEHGISDGLLLDLGCGTGKLTRLLAAEGYDTVSYTHLDVYKRQGLFFALFHGNFYQFFYALLLGMVFAWLYSSTGRIRYNIMLHMLINLMGGVLPIMMSPGMDLSLIPIFCR